MSRKIHIDITDDEFKQLLSKYIVIPNKDKFVDLISGHLCKDSFTMGQVFKAMLGIYSTLNYKEGQYVYVPFDRLATWRVDKDLTLKLPGVVGDQIPCFIKKVEPFSETPYSVVYQAVRTAASLPEEQDYMVTEQGISGKVENIEDVLDQMEDEQVKKNIDPDTLPF